MLYIYFPSYTVDSAQMSWVEIQSLAEEGCFPIFKLIQVTNVWFPLMWFSFMDRRGTRQYKLRWHVTAREKLQRQRGTKLKLY